MLEGKREGTRFAAREARYSSFKLWLKYAKPSRGTLVIDAGATRAVREGSASLLPVGVVEVLGDFDCRRRRGDRSRRGGRARRRPTLAKGICSYTAEELRRVMGMKSDAVREVLPRASDEAVHRDYLVMDCKPISKCFWHVRMRPLYAAPDCHVPSCPCHQHGLHRPGDARLGP